MTAHEHHDATAAPEFWEEFYRDREVAWGRRPNPLLVDVVTEVGLRAGQVLELGAGHGGDSVWLATQGWTVTSVDVSATALRRVDDAAAEAGVADRVRTERHELPSSFPDGEFDLVTATYFQSPLALDRSAVLRRAADSVTTGGRVVVIDHGSAPPWSTGDAHPAFPTAAETLAGLHPDADTWQVEVCAGRSRQAEGPDGETATLTDTVIVLRRRARR